MSPAAASTAAAGVTLHRCSRCALRTADQNAAARRSRGIIAPLAMLIIMLAASGLPSQVAAARDGAAAARSGKAEGDRAAPAVVPAIGKDIELGLEDGMYNPSMVVYRCVSLHAQAACAASCWAAQPRA
jgi:hypothetical protein